MWIVGTRKLWTRGSSWTLLEIYVVISLKSYGKDLATLHSYWHLSCFLSSLNIMHTVNVILWDCSELQHVKQSRKKAGHQWHAWIGEEVGNTFTHILTLWNQCVAAPVRGCCPFTGMPLTLSECQWLWQQKHGMGHRWNNVKHRTHAIPICTY